VSASGATVPARPGTVLVAPLADGWAVYDRQFDRVTVVSALAGLVLASPGQPTDQLVAEVAAAAGTDPIAAAEAVASVVEGLVEAGLLAGSSHRPPVDAVPTPPTGEPDGSSPDADGLRLARDRPGTSLSPPQALLDHRLVFRSTDAALLADIDAYLGVDPCEGEPTMVFDVEPTEGGGVLLQAAEDWEFPDRDGFLVQLPGVINDFAPRAASFLVLHAGAVRHPDGSITVVAGLPEAGKSTLTVALVQAGAEYLGDELTGVRPGSLGAVGFPRSPALDDPSRRVLGLVGEATSPFVPIQDVRPGTVTVTGDAGPITRIILPTYDPSLDPTEDGESDEDPVAEPGASGSGTDDHTDPVAAGGQDDLGARAAVDLWSVPPVVETLTPRQALESLLGATLNLHTSGQVGWETLCQLAEQVPVLAVRHNDSATLAQALTTNQL